MTIRKLTVHKNLAGYGEYAAQVYHKDFWDKQEKQIAFFLEKRALMDVVMEITQWKWHLPLYIGGGQQSETLIYELGTALKENGKPGVLYVISDFDPGGARMLKAFDEGSDDCPGGLSRFTGDVEIEVHKLALTEHQIEIWKLPSRSVKPGDKDRQKWLDLYGDNCTELDALLPHQLQGIINNRIESYMTADQLVELTKIQDEERKAIAETMKSIHT